MTKAILLIWIGVLQQQTLGIDHFNSMAECQAAADALRSHDHRLTGICLPYEAPSVLQEGAKR
jgi:hypothetical protein